MEINTIFEFGQYKSLSLLEVYQGRKNFDRELLKGYLDFCLLDKTIPKPDIFDLVDLQIGIKEIYIMPQIHNEEKPATLKNRIEVGDITNILNGYFNNYFSRNLLEIIPSFQHFNRDNGPSTIGGDPEYISWCMNTISEFFISDRVKKELEEKIIYRFIGINIQKTDVCKNHYTYEPIIIEDFYKF